jgi:hypothetical protein
MIDGEYEKVQTWECLKIEDDEPYYVASATGL